MPITPIDSPYLVPFDGSFELKKAPAAPTERGQGKKKLKKALAKINQKTAELQRALYAQDSWSVLLVFQAMDAAGKDGTIRAVMSGINPAGCQVSSFKAPSQEEIDHDFLWRVNKKLPERGRIGIFNRSHYEEVLVVRVHPEYLGGQRLPELKKSKSLWPDRYDSIRSFEQHVARNGTAVVKFWLNVSRQEQAKRFLARIDEPKSNWKFNKGDVKERGHWDAYMAAYQDALNETSRPWAPWYAIPANDKPFMRKTVAEIVLKTLETIDPKYPTVSKKARDEMLSLRQQLVDGG